MLYQVKYDPTIAKNIVKAFKEIHTRRVYHGDVRCENILIRPDHSVVLIDFKGSEINTDVDSLDAEMREFKAYWRP